MLAEALAKDTTVLLQGTDSYFTERGRFDAMQLQQCLLPQSDPCLRRNKTPVWVQKEVTAHAG